MFSKPVVTQDSIHQNLRAVCTIFGGAVLGRIVRDSVSAWNEYHGRWTLFAGEYAIVAC